MDCKCLRDYSAVYLQPASLKPFFLVLMNLSADMLMCVQHINDMSGTLLVDDVLTLAEAVYLQLRSCRDLPSDIHEILAISSPQSDHQGPFSSALPASVAEATQKPTDSHVTQSLYSVHTAPGGSRSGREVTLTNDDSSIEILSESV